MFASQDLQGFWSHMIPHFVNFTDPTPSPRIDDFHTSKKFKVVWGWKQIFPVEFIQPWIALFYFNQIGSGKKFSKCCNIDIIFREKFSDCVIVWLVYDPGLDELAVYMLENGGSII